MSAKYASRYEAVFLCIHPEGPKMSRKKAAKYMKKTTIFIEKWIQRYRMSRNVDDIPQRYWRGYSSIRSSLDKKKSKITTVESVSDSPNWPTLKSYIMRKQKQEEQERIEAEKKQKEKEKKQKEKEEQQKAIQEQLSNLESEVMILKNIRKLYLHMLQANKNEDQQYNSDLHTWQITAPVTSNASVIATAPSTELTGNSLMLSSPSLPLFPSSSKYVSPYQSLCLKNSIVPMSEGSTVAHTTNPTSMEYIDAYNQNRSHLLSMNTVSRCPQQSPQRNVNTDETTEQSFTTLTPLYSPISDEDTSCDELKDEWK